jgi:hypothetical protein
VPYLTLQLQCGKSFLGAGHKVYGNKPVAIRQFAGLKYCATPEGRAGVASLALELKNTLLPIMVLTSTLTTDNTLLFSHLFEFPYAGRFVRKIFDKFD